MFLEALGKNCIAQKIIATVLMHYLTEIYLFGFGALSIRDCVHLLFSFVIWWESGKSICLGGISAASGGLPF